MADYDYLGGLDKSNQPTPPAVDDANDPYLSGLVAPKDAFKPSAAAPKQVELQDLPKRFNEGLSAASTPIGNFGRGVVEQLYGYLSPFTGQKAVETGGGRAYNAGRAVGETIPTIFAPQRIIPQAVVGGIQGALEPTEGGVTQRLQNAASQAGKNALLQGVVNTVARAGNALIPGGAMTEAGKAAKFAESQGLNPTAGDILNNNLLRKMEDYSVFSPSKGQSKQVEKLLTGNGTTESVITDSLKRNYDSAMNEVSNAYRQLDAAGQQAAAIPASETYRGLSDLLKYPAARTALASLHDDTRALIDTLIQSGKSGTPANLTFDQLDTIRRAIGNKPPKLTGEAAQSVQKDLNRDWDKAYSGVMNDLEYALQKDAPLLKDAASAFKEKVLPFRSIGKGAPTPITLDILNGKFEGNPRLLAEKLRQLNPEQLAHLTGLLDEEGRKAIEAIKMTPRGMKSYATETPIGPNMTGSGGAIGGGIAGVTGMMFPHYSVPALGAAAIEQAGIHALNSPPLKAMLKASPDLFNQSSALGSALNNITKGVGKGGLNYMLQDKQYQNAKERLQGGLGNLKSDLYTVRSNYLP